MLRVLLRCTKVSFGDKLGSAIMEKFVIFSKIIKIGITTQFHYTTYNYVSKEIK